MNKTSRISSIDAMRGITIFLMLFVNDLFVPGVPAWLVHKPADFDGMGLADWVFPGFLFMVGMAVPFAINSRLNRSESKNKISLHILFRTASLLLIGVLMYNIGRLNPQISPIGKYAWALLMLLCVFLIWNNYSAGISKFLVIALKAAGIIGLGILAVIFRSGTPENPGWMGTGWWGILGLIGWGYVVAAFTYLFFRDNLFHTGLVLIFFLSLNILSQLHVLNFLDPVKPVFGVIIGGNVPLMVMAGLFASLLLRNDRIKISSKPFLLASVGILVLASGFVLRNWFIISKIKGTPSWALVCTGISMILFSFLYYFADYRKNPVRLKLFEKTGQRSLTAYLAPDIIYYLIWIPALPVLFYKNSGNTLIVTGGSLVWAFAMIGFASLLNKCGIRLKL